MRSEAAAMNGWLRVVVWCAGVYATFVLVAWLAQARLVYFPDPARIDPRQVGLASVEERWLTAPDGTRVIAWYAPARAGLPTLLYFHGNGGSLANRAGIIGRFMREGIGVYMMSYRGYSGSGGRPSEAANVADARLAYANLRAGGVAARDVVLYGESLGTGIAARLAAELPAGGLVLEAPYTSIVDIGAGQFPFLPVRLLMTERYETISLIGKVRMPLLVVHGEDDRVIPVGMGRTIHAAALNAMPRSLVTLPGAGHNDHHRYGSFEAIVTFLRELK
jgi:fermentation-respiration switch protein FrsA (DUF1100 family)